MFGYDQQMQFATAVAKSFTDATTTAMAASTTFWGTPKTPEPGRSWYRPPAAPNPFDLTTWMTPASTNSMPWAAWGTSFNPMATVNPFAAGNPMMAGSAVMPWSAIAAFASAMAAIQPAQQYWSQFMPMTRPASTASFPWQSMMWPMTQFGAFAAAITAPAEFASYRSPGGHATAQITHASPPPTSWSSSRLH